MMYWECGCNMIRSSCQEVPEPCCRRSIYCKGGVNRARSDSRHIKGETLTTRTQRLTMCRWPVYSPTAVCSNTLFNIIHYGDTEFPHFQIPFLGSTASIRTGAAEVAPPITALLLMSNTPHHSTGQCVQRSPATSSHGHGPKITTRGSVDHSPS